MIQQKLSFEEVINIYLPNVVYDKNNIEYKEKLKNILYAYLSGDWNISIEKDIWIMTLITNK